MKAYRVDKNKLVFSGIIVGEHYLRTQHHKIFHQLTADFQVMCLDSIEVTSGTVMEHRPHSGPEKCKYCILSYINFLLV